MALAIGCFGIEAMFVYITFLVRVIGGPLSTGYSWAMLVIVYILFCLSAYSIKRNVTKINCGEKLTSNLGYVFSLLSLILGAIFLTILRYSLFF